MTSTPNQLRDAGLTAFKNQDLATAQANLTEAIQQQPDDALAHLYLGGVYHQLGRHQDALPVLQRAADLSPQHPQIRYNLGIVHEKLGHMPEAYAAYQQALALQPDYPLASQGLARLAATPTIAPMASAPSIPSVPPIPTVPTVPTIPTVPTLPAMPGYAAQPTAQPYAQPMQGYAPAYTPPVPTDLAGNPLPSAQPTYPQPTPPQPTYPPQAYVQPPYPQPGYQQPGYPQPGYPQPAYGQPPIQPAYGGFQPAPYAAGVPMGREDRFDLGQAFKDMIQITFRPNEFYAEEAGATGIRAPFATILAYIIVLVIAAIFLVLVISAGNPIALFGAMIGVAIAVPIYWILFVIISAISAGLLHLCAKMFAGDGNYSSTYRNYVFSIAPVFLVMAIGMIGLTPFMPHIPTNQNQGSRLNGNTYTYTTPYSSGAGNNGFGNSGTNPNGFGGGYNSSSSSYSRQSYGANSMFSPTTIMAMGVFGLLWLLGLLIAGVRHLFVLGKGLIRTHHISVGATVGVIAIYCIISIILNVGFQTILTSLK